MCGIVAYIGGQDATPIVVDGLKKLEYRGYDSAGVAILDDGKIEIRRVAGKVALLEKLVENMCTAPVIHLMAETTRRPYIVAHLPARPARLRCSS